MKNETIITDKDLPPEVVEAIRSGRKIEAIKLLRISTGLGLANAKVLVDSAARRLCPPVTSPPAMQDISASPGLVKFLLLALGMFLAYRFILNG